MHLDKAVLVGRGAKHDEKMLLELRALCAKCAASSSASGWKPKTSPTTAISLALGPWRSSQKKRARNSELAERRPIQDERLNTTLVDQVTGHSQIRGLEADG